MSSRVKLPSLYVLAYWKDSATLYGTEPQQISYACVFLQCDVPMAAVKEVLRAKKILTCLNELRPRRAPVVPSDFSACLSACCALDVQANLTVPQLKSQVIHRTVHACFECLHSVTSPSATVRIRLFLCLVFTFNTRRRCATPFFGHI